MPTRDDVFKMLRSPTPGVIGDVFDAFSEFEARSEGRRTVSVASSTALIERSGERRLQVVPTNRIALLELDRPFGNEPVTQVTGTLTADIAAALRDRPFSRQFDDFANDEGNPDVDKARASFARQLMMINQDMAAFGAPSASEVDRLNPDAMYRPELFVA